MGGMNGTEQTGRPLHRTFRGHWLFLVLLLGTFAAVFSRYWIDLPVAEWCWTRHYGIGDAKYPKGILDFLVVAEAFGNWLGMVVATVLIIELDGSWRWRLFRYFTSIFWAGLIVNLIKIFVVRLRPQGFRFRTPDLVLQQNVISIDWTPWASAFKGLQHSFPSGHTATAFAACVVLSFFYPKGKRVFLLLAVLVGIQRIVVCAHFPSDVIVGAMIGLFVGSACTSFSPLARFCDRLESPK